MNEDIGIIDIELAPGSDGFTYSLDEQLRYLVKEKGFPLAVISKVTGITEERLLVFLEEDIVAWMNFTDGEKMKLSHLLSMMTIGMECVTPDERLTAITENLICFGIEKKAIADRAGVSAEDVEQILTNIEKVPYEKRYQIGMSVMMMYLVFKDKIQEEELEAARKLNGEE